MELDLAHQLDSSLALSLDCKLDHTNVHMSVKELDLVLGDELAYVLAWGLLVGEDEAEEDKGWQGKDFSGMLALSTEWVSQQDKAWVVYVLDMVSYRLDHVSWVCG